MRIGLFGLGVTLACWLGVAACSSDGDGGSRSSDEDAAAPDGDGEDDAGGSDGRDAGGDAETGNTDPDAAKLSFMRDGELVSFDGKNDASYYQQSFGSWRLFVVVNDVLGDKYFSLEVSGLNGEMVAERTYDCGKTADEEAMGRAKVTYRSGDGDAEEHWVQGEGLDCSITISSIGEVGGRITGSFEAVLQPKDDPEGQTIAIAGGTFDVERHEF